jgi:hypothetical protein
LCKILAIQRLFSLDDEQLEFWVSDNLLFELPFQSDVWPAKRTQNSQRDDVNNREIKKSNASDYRCNSKVCADVDPGNVF